MALAILAFLAEPARTLAAIEPPAHKAAVDAALVKDVDAGDYRKALADAADRR